LILEFPRLNEFFGLWQALNLAACHRYLYYFDRQIPQITSTVIQGLVELIVTDPQSEGAEGQIDPYLANTLRYIRFQTQKGDFIAERYSAIQMPM